MAYKLVNLKTGAILTENITPQKMGGEYGAGLESGELVWLLIPEGMRPDEVLLQDGALVVDAAKKTAREQRTQTREALVARIKSHVLPATVNNSNQLRPILADILELLKGDL